MGRAAVPGNDTGKINFRKEIFVDKNDKVARWHPLLSEVHSPVVSCFWLIVVTVKPIRDFYPIADILVFLFTTSIIENYQITGASVVAQFPEFGYLLLWQTIPVTNPIPLMAKSELKPVFVKLKFVKMIDSRQWSSKKPEPGYLSFCRPGKEIQLEGEAENGIVGMKLIGEIRPDIVFLDIEMPRMDGFEMLHRLPQKNFTSFSQPHMTNTLLRLLNTLLLIIC